MAVTRFRSPGTEQKTNGKWREIGLYSLIYLIFFSFVFLPVIIRDGLILGGDGYGIYYPTLVNLRSSLLEFGRNIKNGSFRFPMMNYNYGFGTDNLTALMMCNSFLPVFALTVFMPVSWLPAFLTGTVFLMDYLAGIAFLKLCRHFGHRSEWNSLMALSYACCTGFIDNYLYNPHFMYMMIAFPLMVIGIDRVIHKTGWRLLCFSVFWIGITSFTLLVYTLPFLALFALLRVWFVYREHFIQNLLKAFLRCVPVVTAGFLLSAVIQLPVLYLLQNSARSFGNATVSLREILLPDLNRMGECFFLIEPTMDRAPTDINPMFIAIPGLMLMLLVLRKHKELRANLIAMIVCVSVPLVAYGLNGFQYSLIRWGFVPALLFSIAGSVGMSEFRNLNKKQCRRIVCILCFYWVTFSSVYFLKYEAGNLCAALILIAAVCRMIPPLCRLWNRFTRSAADKVRSLLALLKGKTPSVKRYLASAGAVIGLLAVFLFAIVVIFLPQYTFYPQLPVTAGLTAAAAFVILKKPKWASACTRILAVCFFGFSVLLYCDYHESKFEEIQPDKMFQMLRETPVSENTFGRTLYIKADPDEEPEESDASETNSEQSQTMDIALQTDGFPKCFNVHQYSNQFLTNYSLIYGFPDTAYFHSMMDSDLQELTNRSGLDGFDIPAFTDFEGYGEREVLYSLLGIQTVGSKKFELSGFGLNEIRSEPVGEQTYRVYEYPYALPVGVTYDRYLSKDTLQSLDAAYYPYALMQSAYVERKDGSTVPADTEPDVSACRCDAKIEKEFVKKNSVGMDVYHYTVTLNEDVSDCFLYLDAEKTNVRYPYGIDLKGFTVTIDNDETKRFMVMNDCSVWQWLRRTDRYAFSLGYQEAPVTTLEFELPMECEKLSVYAIPSSVLTDAYEERCKETLQNVQFRTNQLDGDITVSSDKLLSVGLIHNDGWRVFLDGREAPLCKVNGLFLGVQLTEGSHHVQFVYRTAWLIPGIICTCIGIAMWILMEILTRKKKQSAQKQE